MAAQIVYIYISGTTIDSVEIKVNPVISRRRNHLGTLSLNSSLTVENPRRYLY